MTLKRSGSDGWSFDSLDYGCRPLVIKGGLSGETWRIDPASPPPTPSSTTLSLLVRDDACNSGEPPDADRILSPRIDYGAKAVTVTYRILPPDGPQTCEGTPPARVALTLEEPLGRRDRLDGAPVGPRPRFP